MLLNDIFAKLETGKEPLILYKLLGLLAQHHGHFYGKDEEQDPSECKANILELLDMINKKTDDGQLIIDEILYGPTEHTGIANYIQLYIYFVFQYSF